MEGVHSEVAVFHLQLGDPTLLRKNWPRITSPAANPSAVMYLSPRIAYKPTGVQYQVHGY